MKHLIYFFMLSLLFACSDDEPVVNEPVDPCDEITCVQGSCEDGTCLCPDGFTGETCADEIPPSSMTILEVSVNSYVEGDYDIDTDADIYIVIRNEAGVELFTGDFMSNVPTNVTATWNTENLLIQNPSDQHLLELWDADSGDDLFITSLEFSPYVAGDSFPNIVEIVGDDITFSLNAEYEL